LASAFIVAVIALTPFNLQADDWPQWRGPNRDGVWRETGLLQKFPKENIDVAWRTDIASGYSGPTVANGKVYVTDRLTKPKQVERVHCVDEKTGKPLWSYAYDCPYRNVGYEAGPRASVLIDEGRAYSLGAMGNLFCFDAAKGDVLWQKDLNIEYQIEMPIWGIAASPVIEGDLIIVQLGGKDACLAAFDKKTGKEKWHALSDRASYSAPIVIDQAGQRVLVCWTGDRVVGLDPQSGKLHWEHPFKPSRMVLAIATPVFHDNTLFVTAFYDGSLLLKVDPDKLAVEKVWRRKGPDEKKTDSLHAIISTPYLQGDHIYGVDSYGELRCLELATGDRVWESLDAVPKARWANIHFVKNGENVWMFNERGELIISKLSPEGFKEISRAKLIEPTTHQLPQRGGVCWSHPAFANKHVFIRNDNELLCASLAAE
jgi:outer membrane protein assembly factor BamB